MKNYSSIQRALAFLKHQNPLFLENKQLLYFDEENRPIPRKISLFRKFGTMQPNLSKFGNGTYVKTDKIMYTDGKIFSMLLSKEMHP